MVKVTILIDNESHGKNLQSEFGLSFLIEDEISNLSEKEFRVMKVKVIQDLRNRIETQIKKIKKSLIKT